MTPWVMPRVMPQGNRFPLAVAAAFIALLVGYRLWIGAGFGLGLFAVDGEAISSGFLYNQPDNDSYASWPKQTERGSVLYTNLFTTEDHRAAYFNPYFWLVGSMAGLLDVPVTGIMVVFGMLASAFTIVCVFYIARLAGFKQTAARWTTVLVAFASGLSWPWITFERLLGHPPPAVGADLSFQDAIPFSAAFAYPYQAVSLALLACALLLALACEHEAGARFRKTLLAALGCVVLFLSLTRPYEALMLLATYILYAAWGAMRGGPGTRTRLAIGGVLALCVGSALAYALWVGRQPVWNAFASGSTDLWRPRSFWLIGYGLLLPLAVLAAIPELLRREAGARAWPAVWTLLCVLLLVVINVKQSKLASGAFLPMAVMAGQAMSAVGARIAGMRAGTARRLMLATCLLLLAGFFPTSAYLLARIYKNITYDSGIAQAARIIEDSDTPFPVVLCDIRAGSVLPVLAAARVFVGHWSMTPHSSSKHERLIEAGIQRPRGDSAPIADPKVFRDLIEETEAEFILLRERSPAVPFADALAPFERTSIAAPWRLYRRR